jgi:hypothetical protein
MAVAHDRASGQRSAAWPQPNLSGESEFDVGALAAGEAGFGVRSQQLPLSARAAAIARRHFDSEKAVAAATALQSASRRFKP